MNCQKNKLSKTLAKTAGSFEIPASLHVALN
jgi:hypothetical protein